MESLACYLARFNNLSQAFYFCLKNPIFVKINPMNMKKESLKLCGFFVFFNALTFFWKKLMHLRDGSLRYMRQFAAMRHTTVTQTKFFNSSLASALHAAWSLGSLDSHHI